MIALLNGMDILTKSGSLHKAIRMLCFRYANQSQSLIKSAYAEEERS